MTPLEISKCVDRVIKKHCSDCVSYSIKEAEGCMCPEVTGELKVLIGNLDDLNNVVDEWKNRQAATFKFH